MPTGAPDPDGRLIGMSEEWRRSPPLPSVVGKHDAVLPCCGRAGGRSDHGCESARHAQRSGRGVSWAHSGGTPAGAGDAPLRSTGPRGETVFAIGLVTRLARGVRSPPNTAPPISVCATRHHGAGTGTTAPAAGRMRLPDRRRSAMNGQGAVAPGWYADHREPRAAVGRRRWRDGVSKGIGATTAVTDRSRAEDSAAAPG